MMVWIDIGTLGDIPRRGARCVVTPEGSIAVFRTQDDQVFALQNRCPHRAGPLSEGMVHDGSVTCPLHNWVLDLRTGRAMGADEGSVRTFTVEAVDGRIRLALETALAAAE